MICNIFSDKASVHCVCSLYELSGFWLLVLKYVLGYSDLVLVPLLLLLLDPELRAGVPEVCRTQRAAREPAESSVF